MNTTSRIITGIIALLIGLMLIAFSFFESIFLLVYGIPVTIISFFILFNKNEDKIEQIKE